MIELAAEEINLKGDKVTISRLSVMTGLHRRDVMRIYRDLEPKESPLSLTARVIGQWTQDKDFLTKGGKPRVLGFRGEESEFSQLVQRVSKDVNAATLIFELERQGAIQTTARGLKLLHVAENSLENLEASYRVMSQDALDLMEAVSENLETTDSQELNLHVRTEYDNVAVDRLPEIKQWLLVEGSKFHAKVRKYLSKFDYDINPTLSGPRGGKVVIGSFSRTEKSSNKE